MLHPCNIHPSTRLFSHPSLPHPPILPTFKIKKFKKRNFDFKSKSCILARSILPSVYPSILPQCIRASFQHSRYKTQKYNLLNFESRCCILATCILLHYSSYPQCIYHHSIRLSLHPSILPSSTFQQSKHKFCSF